MQEELAVGDGRTQIVLQRIALAQALVHLRIEEPHRLAPIEFGPIERRVGIGEKRHGIGAVTRVDGRPNAEPDRNLLLAHIELFLDRLEDSIGEVSRSLRLFPAGRNDDELVAADARDETVADGLF